jgi:hypothetical protein
VFWCGGETIEIKGSVHVTADKRQNEDETIAINRVVFTTRTDVQPFNVLGPDAIWIGSVSGVRFAFSRSGPRYKQAGIFHYVGDAVYPALESQLSPPAVFDPANVIVSNSLPAWLRLVDYDPVWLNAPNPRVLLFPSFAVPDNIRPPYGSVHIEPQQTQALQLAPDLGRRTTSQDQLSSDRVRVTLYGLDNRAALDFVNLVNQFSEDTDAIGMMTPALIRDEKRTQAELGILAMKKTIEYTASYRQGVMRDIARTLIKNATATILPQPSA